MLIGNLTAVEEKKRIGVHEHAEFSGQDCDNASAELLNIIDFKVPTGSPSPTQDDLEVLVEFEKAKRAPEMFFSAESPIVSHDASLEMNVHEHQ